TPELVLDSGQALARIERLANIVVGTGLQSRDTVDRIGSGRDHDDAKPPTAFAQPACEREPVLAGESNIKQNQTRELTVDEPAQCGPAVDAGHTEILFAEVLDQQLALGGLVLDRDDMWPVIPILRLSDLRLPNRGGRWT